MKNISTIAALLLIVSTVTNAQSEVPLPKLSPRTQQYLLAVKQTHSDKPIPEYIYKRTIGGLCMSALLKVGNRLHQSDLDVLHVHINTRAGSVWTALIPIANVPALAQVRGIEYIELDEPVCMRLDSVRKTTRADSVQQGIGLPMPYTGAGVVVGVIDVGFDYTHPTFYDTSGSMYRVKRIWQEKSIGTPPSGFGYGSEITDSNAIRAALTDNRVNSHGMHVAGIAAGSGYGSSAISNSRYRGIAYESDIVLVGIMPDSLQWQQTGMSDFIDGMHYIYSYAAAVGKPAVINLSWGSPVGPRDGNSLFSQACDALTGAGKIFVCAAGNDGDVNLHLSKSFLPTDTIVSTFVNFASYLHTKNTWVDIWGDSAKQFCIKVSLYTANAIDSTAYVCLDNMTHQFYLKGSNGDTCFVTMTTSSAEFNGKPRVYLSLYSRVTDSICLQVKGTDGLVHIWNGYVRSGGGYFGTLTANGRAWASDGNADYTVSDMVATRSAISIGAYSAKISFRNISGQSYSYSNYTSRSKLIPFSSHGPSAAGLIKPDITAPGLSVVSSLSSFDSLYLPGGVDYVSVISSYHDAVQNKNYYYGELSGTSMASPAAAGIVALMLQANPHLTPTQVRNILAQTAILDTFTGQLPAQGTNTWGHGKINAYQAVIQAALLTGETNIVTNHLACKLYPNPTTGSFTMAYTGDKAETLAIEVYDIHGRQVTTDSWMVNAGNNTHTMNLSKLATGIYLTKVISAQGYAMIKTVVER